MAHLVARPEDEQGSWGVRRHRDDAVGVRDVRPGRRLDEVQVDGHRKDVVRPVAEEVLRDRLAGEAREEDEEERDEAADREPVVPQPAPDELP